MAPRPYTPMLLAAALGAPLLSVPGGPAAPGRAPGAPAAASLAADPGALVNRVTRLRGTMPDVAPGGAVQIQRLDAVRGWVAEATTTVDAGGAFVARWRPRVVGRFTVRAVAGSESARAAAAA